MPHLRQPLLVNRDKLPCRESSIFPDKQVSLAGKRKNGHRVILSALTGFHIPLLLRKELMKNHPFLAGEQRRVVFYI